MLGSGDGAHPGWTTDFYPSHQVVTSTYTSLQVASLLPVPRSSPGHCPQGAHPIPAPPPPFPLEQDLTAYLSPAFFLQEAFLLQEASPSQGRVWHGLAGAWGNGHPHISVGDWGSLTDPRHPLVERVERGEKTKLQGGNLVRGVWAGRGTAKGGLTTWGAAHPTEGTLSLPPQEPQWTEKRLAQAASAPWGLLTRRERQVRGDTGLRAGGFNRVSGPEQLCELRK